MCCPVLAGDGVLNGLRGESRHWGKQDVFFDLFVFFQGSTCKLGDLFPIFSRSPKAVRRIEDKLNSMSMEAKLVQIMFDTSGLQGNRRLVTMLGKF